VGHRRRIKHAEAKHRLSEPGYLAILMNYREAMINERGDLQPNRIGANIDRSKRGHVCSLPGKPLEEHAATCAQKSAVGTAFMVSQPRRFFRGDSRRTGAINRRRPGTGRSDAVQSREVQFHSASDVAEHG